MAREECAKNAPLLVEQSHVDMLFDLVRSHWIFFAVLVALNTFPCRRVGGKLPDAIWEEVLEGLKQVEDAFGAKFGDKTNPLLVSVRSGAAVRADRQTHMRADRQAGGHGGRRAGRQVGWRAGTGGQAGRQNTDRLGRYWDDCRALGRRASAADTSLK
jgi:hypothetical protein